jgi:tetratricopeptide (TPR) repeat protein
MHRGFVGVLAIGIWLGASQARADCEPRVADFVSVTGAVEVQRETGAEWISAALDTGLCEGNTIRVGERSRAAVALVNEAVLRIDENTTIRLLDITGEPNERSWLDLINGAFQSFSRKPRFLTVSTPYLNGSIEGTEFVARVDAGSSEILVLEGVVRAANAQGEVAVGAGEAASAGAGESPERRIVVRPRDQVQWSLFYPPILSASTITPASPGLAEAKACADRGDTVCAFNALERVPAAQRDGDYLLLRASLLLSVGRVDEAKADLDALLGRDPGAGQAYALRSVIAVAQNNNAAALEDARRGVELSPDSTAAKIALSYAQQADLDLQAARDTLLQATQEHPQDALAWARLGELWLMLGDRRQARAAAERAVALDPDLSRTQIVLGFAALTEIRIKQARTAFEKAIVLDSSDPLPRLGLGLAMIRAGDLAEGRGELEAAVALDSNDSLLRAYLGKAYFEEKRDPLDADQLAIAKQLDPLDPTAYLYDAIRLQTDNQPVKALRELDRSIELNDNRAIYRGRLLLDQDRAARGTSQARIYNDLGFTRLGYNEASTSLAIDPSNASAHRLLSDIYRASPRSEVSRVSDLLQSQLLQDVNINPVQPSLAATNLNIIARSGPATAGFNEFTPLFERNQVQVNSSVLAGGDDTVAIEGVASGIYDRYSFSGGGFYYDTAGFRENANLSHKIGNFYAQAALTPELNIQAEYGTRNSEWGDIAMKFDLEDYDPTYRRSLDSEVWRIGARISPGPRSNILLSVISTDREIEGTETDELFFIPGFGAFNLRTDIESDDQTDQYDGQYLFQGEGFNLTVGGAYADVDRKDILEFVVETPFGDDPPFVFEDAFTIRDSHGYAYVNITALDGVLGTLGVSYQEYEEGELFDFNRVNPKIGVEWDVTDDLLFRAAYFQGVKPVLSANRTLEPTQIAGFTQYFDDPNATKFDRYGLALDWRVNRYVFVGAEATKRDLEAPLIDADTGTGAFEDREEWTHRFYTYWTPTDRWAVSADLVYDKFENQSDSQLADLVPSSIRTISLPLVARYFSPNGFFASVGVTYVDQTVTGEETYAHKTGDSDFLIFDMGVGFRLPKRTGLISLVVQNLFDEDFDYLDNSYRTFQDEPAIGPYAPDRTITAQLTVHF